MCLAIPMKVTEKTGSEVWVESSGTRRKISVALCKDIRVGDYVIVHAGFAIERLDEEKARLTLKAFKEIEDAA